MSTTSGRRHQIANSLQDKEYRDLFVIEEINTGVPFQIRAMRQARGWSQEQLADRLGMTQTGISRLENPDYGRLTLTTLKRLASVFDVGLAVRFVPFSHLVDWSVNFSPDDLAVPGFDDDLGLRPGLLIQSGAPTMSTGATNYDDTRDDGNRGPVNDYKSTAGPSGLQVEVDDDSTVRGNNIVSLADYRLVYRPALESIVVEG